MVHTLWGDTRRTRSRRTRKTRHQKAAAPYSITGSNDCAIIGHALTHWGLAGTTTCIDCGAKVFCPYCIEKHPTDEKAVAVVCPLHEKKERSA